MKWFKHEVDAEEGKIVVHIIRKYGLEGESRYWRLVGLLAKNYPPDKKGFFTLAMETIQTKLRHRSIKDCTLFLDHLADYKPLFDASKRKQHSFSVEYSDNYCRIKYDKIAEIKDNYTKDLQASGKRHASNLPLDKEEENKNKKKRKIKSDSPLFSFFEIWKTEMEPKGYNAPPAMVDQAVIDAFQGLQDSFNGVLPAWPEYFLKIHASDFLREIKYGGKPTVLWAADPENYRRVMAGEFDNSKKNKVNTPAIVEEITNLVRTYGPNEHEIILKKATPEARLVFESSSQTTIRNSNEFELRKLIANTFKECA